MSFLSIKILAILALAIILTACYTVTPSTVHDTVTVLPLPVTPSGPDLLIDADWQIQYTGEIDLSLDVDVYNLDLFEVSADDISSLHSRGIYVMCYFSAGSWEDWRPDADHFPAEVIGKDYAGWPGEKWLDVRAVQTITPLMESRVKLAAEKGCDGIDPDNVNGFENETGFPISYANQLDFNLWLARTAHSNELEIGLKNDLNQIAELLPFFDWALNEECFSYNECELLIPFRLAGKPVFVIEYETEPVDFCPQAQALSFNAIFKNWELDAYREACP